jgi:hypothetical protein
MAKNAVDWKLGRVSLRKSGADFPEHALAE